MTDRLDPELLSILVCPQCKGALEVRRGPGGAETSLDCIPCGLAYPVEEGIPVMLVEEARPLAGREGGGAGSPAGVRRA